MVAAEEWEEVGDLVGALKRLLLLLFYFIDTARLKSSTTRKISVVLDLLGFQTIFDDTI